MALEPMQGGLMPRQQPPVPGGMPGGEGGQPMAGDNMQQASPEEQDRYNQFVGNGMKLIYSENTFPKVVEILGSGDDPRAGLAQATAMVVSRAIQSAKQAGSEISGDVMMHGGTELFEELADVATKAGIHDFAKDQDAMEGALFRAMDLTRKGLQGMGLVDENAVKQDAAKLEQMNQSGELESMLRNLARNDRRGASPEQADSQPMAPEA